MRPILAVLILALPACSAFQQVVAPEPAEESEPLSAIGPLAPVGAQTAAALDQSTPEEVAAATAPAAGARELGRTVVALGSPAEQGFWISTSLVTVPGKGRVVTEGGTSVNVDLRPSTGGSLLSLAAFRQLGLGLTDLPEVTVFTE
jgi:hypothetical protein